MKRRKPPRAAAGTQPHRVGNRNNRISYASDMVKHCAAARKLRRELDAELCANGQAVGDELFWSAAELATLERIACTQDRIEDLQRDYAAAVDSVKLRAALSTEIRLCDGLLSRLLRTVKTDVPQVGPESRATQRGRRAANIRWGNAGA